MNGLQNRRNTEDVVEAGQGFNEREHTPASG
ncbi:hypothetical protein F441_02774 [Phytophthora nicotianae CJ01A1]|uniref:Uncharacterized protein n=3 Tax=Phytophthora nicotianae TaxID=4792 RepID=V9FTK3_PHYNI|nr:hypothetical protein F443_02781 [Phytophthora nicotianae P1569]ETL47616.1 hypothetical protein L916_02653 [Phytophthora nicotianae]ETP24187.1 hypothetical protein F441_02774 [Phytophthora nicotianae CJ01A1]